jgi:hypothetical protein
MSDFPGFAFSGYRSLWGEPQWIPLGNRATVVLGPNNAGKSNVLRLVHQHMAVLFRAVTQNVALSGFDLRLDTPRGRTDPVLIDWPVRVDGLEGKKLAESHLEALTSIPRLTRFGVLTVPMTAQNLESPFEIPLELAEEVLAESRDVPWTEISARITQTRGGAPGSDTQRVLEWLSRHAAWPPPKTVLVPASRSVQPGETDDWDFSGSGVIDHFRRMFNPDFDQGHLRDMARALTHDLRVLLEDENIEITIPADGTTLTVQMGEHHYPCPFSVPVPSMRF